MNKENQNKGLVVIVGQHVGLHGHDGIEVEFGVDELEQNSGEITIPGMLAQIAGAAERSPGQIEHIDCTQHQHRQFDFGNPGGEQGAKQSAKQRHNGEAGKNTEVKRHGTAKPSAACVGHGHNVIWAGGKPGDKGIGQKGSPVEHAKILQSEWH